MSTLEKQNEFDKKKWEDSCNAGHDTCGEYDYCSKCNKSHEYPCAKAYDEYTSSVVSVETPVAVDNVVKVTKKTAAKKTTAKKTCAKKATTTKKTTTKKATKTTKKTK